MSRAKPSTARVVFDWVAGLGLIGLGIVGLFVPVLQGIAFIVGGLVLLSSHSRWARAILDRLKGASRSVRDRWRRRRDARR